MEPQFDRCKHFTFLTRTRRRSVRVTLALWCALAMLPMPRAQAQAYSTYAVGHITRVSFATNGVIIMLDVGVPANCTGVAYGWLVVSSASTPLVAFVTGLWMRGDAPQKQLVVYTSGIDSTGACQVNQIDTGSAG